MNGTNFTAIDYLKTGNPRQQKAFEAISRLNILQDLSAYSPLLAGTIPIGIDLPNSDLDILCSCPDHRVFQEELHRLYCHEKGFEWYETQVRGVRSTVCQFHFRGFDFEVFAQTLPSAKQYAFRHMLIEHRLLQQKGEAFRQEIIRLKQSGMKTEPAFAKALGLEGDPYEALLKYACTT